MDSQHSLRHAFDEEIHALEHDLLEMGSMAESMVGQAIESLTKLDVDLAMEVVRRDDEIDERDIAIETRCLTVLALQQPMAGDLRVVGTAMKMITDIERVGDLAVDIAKIAMKIDKEFGTSDLVDIPQMSSVARSMLRNGLEAFVRRDLALVEQVIRQDDEVDDLYRDLRGQIFESMRREPGQVVTDSWLLLAIHHVERIADHAVNIAERVGFMVTGNLKQFAASHDGPGV